MLKTIITISLLLLFTSAQAETKSPAKTTSKPVTKYYRFKDATGKMVLSNIVNAETAKAGYEIITSQGRVLEVIKPQMTDEEIQLLAQKEKSVQEARNAALRQKTYDEALLLRYSFTSDIEAEKKRKLNELQLSVSIYKGNVKSTRTKLEEDYATAASFERKKKPVPEDLKVRIKTIESDVLIIEKMLNTRKAEVIKMTADYDMAIKRFKEIEEMRKPKPLQQVTPSNDSFSLPPP